MKQNHQKSWAMAYCGIVAALCVGWLIGKALGYPSLRLRGVYGQAHCKDQNQAGQFNPYFFHNILHFKIASFMLL